MRIGNPSLRRWVDRSARGDISSEAEKATYKGIYGKSAILGLLTLASAIVTEIVVLEMMKDNLASALVGVGIGVAVSAVVLLIVSLVIMFVPSTVKVLGVVYSVLQGGLLGCISLLVDILVAPGISISALLGTVIVFLISLAVNKLFKVRISSKFARGLMIAGFSILLVQLVMWVMSLFGVFNYTAYLWVQIVASSICIIWATLMLTWDLQNIDFLVQSGADKKYEWNVAFSLVTTLVYLYIEILELIMRFVMLFGNKKN